MRRMMLLILCILVMLNPISAGAAYLYTESSSEVLSGGIKYEHRTILTENGWIRAYIAYIDISHPNAEIKVMTAEKGSSYLENVKSMAQRQNAIAAINGDFFNFSSSQTNMLGMVYKNGELISTPALDNQASFVINDKNEVIMDYFSFTSSVTSPQGYVCPIYQINKIPVESGAITMLTPAWSANSWGRGLKELVVENDIVKEIRTEAGPMPKNGYVLVTNPEVNGFFDNFAVGDIVTVETSLKPQIDNIKEATGGNTVIVDDGRIAEFTGNVTGYAQRSSVGVMADGKTVILLATDGRQTGCRGLTQTELAELMISLGAKKAINLDGGGSTTFVTKDASGEFKTQNTVSSLRPVSTGIAAVNKGIKGSVAKSGEMSSDKAIVMAGDSITLSPKFYDEYGNNFAFDISSVTFTSSSGEAVTNGIFTPQSAGKYTITATLDEASCQIELESIDKISSIDITDGDAISIKKGESHTLCAVAYDINGRKIDVNPRLAVWLSSSDNITVNNGTITAKNEDYAVIELSYDGKSDYIAVNRTADKKREPLSISSKDEFEGYIDGGSKIAVSGSLPKGATLLNRLFAIERLNELKDYSKAYVTSNYYSEFESSNIINADGYSVYNKDASCFITLDTSNGYIDDVSEWVNLYTAVSGNAKNLVIITENAPSAFPDYEEARFKNILKQATASGKNMFYVYSGGKPQVNIENGVRYISTGEVSGYQTASISDNKSYCSYPVFFVKGNDIKYNFVN